MHRESILIACTALQPGFDLDLAGRIVSNSTLVAFVVAGGYAGVWILSETS